jgi:hypothetical protein
MNFAELINSKYYSFREIWFSCFVSLWLGWLKVSNSIALSLTFKFLTAPHDMNAWGSIPAQFKAVAFFQYGLQIAGILGLGVVALATFWRHKPSTVTDSRYISRPAAVYILLLAGIFNLSIFFVSPLMGGGLWLVLLVCMFLALLRESIILFSAKIINWYISTLLLVLVIFLAVVPSMLGTQALKNDYLDIPEKTILRDGMVIDNQSYINKFNLEGMAVPDLSSSTAGEKFSDYFPGVKTKKTDFVQYLIDSQRQLFAYDQEKGMLFVRRDVDPQDLNKFSAFAKNNDDAQLINGLQSELPHAQPSASVGAVSSEQSEFIKYNLYELSAQVQLGRFFYHHSYFFGPMLFYSIGIDTNRLSMLYGFGDTISVAKVLKWIGGVNFNNYFKVFYASYLLYLVIVILVSWVVLRDRRYFSLVIVGLLAYLVLPGYEDLLQAPGFNPLRHWPDFLMFLALYHFAKSGSWVAGILVALVTAFAIWWSREFGVLIMIGSLAGLTFIGMLVPNFRRAAIATVAISIVSAISVMWYLQGILAPNPSAIYSLIGISMPGTNLHEIDLLTTIIMMVFVVVILLIVTRRIESQRERTLFTVGIACCAYFVASLIYVVWYPSSHHLAPMMPSLMLAIACLVKALCLKSPSNLTERRLLALLPAISMLLVLAPAASFAKEFLAYKQSNQHHVVYTSNLDMLKIKTTMDPKPFESAVDLIRKYDKSNEVVIISKYSHLLPILAAKFNDVGFPELESNLVTKKEVDIARQAIEKSGQEYVFVDRNIEDSMISEIPDSDSYFATLPGFHDEATGRVLALSVLKDVFDGLKGNYKLVESTDLISVYQKVN